MQNITGYTKVYGIIADPIRHSISPLMHNTAFGALGIDGVYVAFETPEEQFDAGVRGLKALGIQGFNVSMPYKRRIMDYLDEISPAARLAATRRWARARSPAGRPRYRTSRTSGWWKA